MTNRLAHQTIVEFLEGDKKAFEQVFKSYYRPIVLFTTKFTGSQDEGEDIATEAFIALFKRHHLFKDEHNIVAFLYLCARNSCLNYLKAKKRHEVSDTEFAERLQDDTLLEYEYSIKTEIVETIHTAIENLPQECRRIFKLLYYEELKPAEVAALLQISVNTVYVQKSRAVNVLRIKLTENPLVIAWFLQVVALWQIEFLITSHTIPL